MDSVSLSDYEVSTKYHCTKETLRETLNQYGVAIIPTILQPLEIQNMKKGMWDYMEHVTSKFNYPIKRDEMKTYRSFYEIVPLYSMLMQHWGIGHAQFAWDLRQNSNIIDVFAKLWSVEPQDLLVSFDGASFHMPPEVTNRGWYQKSWLHTDQSYTRNNFECVQSWVTAYDVNPGDATLTFLEGSNRYHADYKIAFDVTEKSDWYKLDEVGFQFFADKGCIRKCIACPAGSIVLWDSRLQHAGMECLRERAAPNFRGVAYICYTPRYLATKANLSKKQKAFDELRTTNHWPHKPLLFGKTPYTYGKPIANITLPLAPLVSDLGKRLAGF